MGKILVLRIIKPQNKYFILFNLQNLDFRIYNRVWVMLNSLKGVVVHY